MKKLLLITLITLILFVNLASSQVQTIKPIKSGDPANLIQVCDNCTFVNLTKITYPNSSFALRGQFGMTKSGTEYNFTFINTTTIGFYIYTSCGDLNGVTTCSSVQFEVTKSGFGLDISEAVIFFILIFISFFLFAFFLWASIVIPFPNEIEIDEKFNKMVTKVTRTKYIKLIAVWFTLGFFVWFLSLISAIANNFINLDILVNPIVNIYILFYMLLWGYTIIVLPLMLILWFKDLFINKEIIKFGKAFINQK